MSERPAHRTRVLIVDDEPMSRRGARRVLEGRADLEIVGECRNGAEAVREIRSLEPDVVLLDVEMPGMDGFAVIREVGSERMPPVVFVTAYDAHAVHAFQVAAVDFVVKPYTDARLLESVDRASQRLADRRAAAVHERLLDLLTARTGPSAVDSPAAPAPAYLSRLLIDVGTRSVLVPLDDVTWIRADDYCVTVFAGATSYVMRESLASLEQRLDPAAFVRVHRSAIVQVRALRSLERARNGAVAAVLRDGTRVPVSRARRDAVLTSLRVGRG